MGRSGFQRVVFAVFFGRAGDMVEALYGTYNKRIDAKGRLSIPKRIREQIFADSDAEVLVVTMDGILQIFTPGAFDVISRQIQGKSPLNKKAREFQRLWGVLVSPVTCDAEGRIKLTESQKAYAGIEQDVVLIGAWNRLEIWSPVKHAAQFVSSEASESRFSEIADELNFLE
ncbi:hypothetical protein JXA80_03990 [bacterium]|nr:hypothetical protein [candidate division CSSED10-310 bacterium]